MAAKPTTPPADLLNPRCPSRGVLDHVTSRWGTLVLVVLQEGTLRFGEIRRRVGGVSEKMLAQTLRTLEEDGFVARRAYPEVPPRVEYALTPLGAELTPLLESLAGWIEANLGRVLKSRQRRRPSPPRAGVAGRAEP